MTRITLSPAIYIDPESEDSLAGADAARDWWIDKCESTDRGNPAAITDAATGLAESLLTIALVESPERLAAALYGACRLLLEVSSQAVMQEVDK